MLEHSTMPYFFSDPRFLAMAMILLANVANSEDIVCYSAELKQSICKCTPVPRKIWPKDSEIPAPKPDNVTLGWFVHDKDEMKYIGVEINLTQRASHFKVGLKGYYIEVTARLSDPKRFSCTFVDFKTDARYVTFHFNLPQTVYPGTTLNYMIIPLPMYGKNDTPSWVFEKILIPGCGDTAMKEVDECMKKPDNAITTMNGNLY